MRNPRMKCPALDRTMKEKMTMTRLLATWKNCEWWLSVLTSQCADGANCIAVGLPFYLVGVFTRWT